MSRFLLCLLICWIDVIAPGGLLVDASLEVDGHTIPQTSVDRPCIGNSLWRRQWYSISATAVLVYIISSLQESAQDQRLYINVATSLGSMQYSY